MQELNERAKNAAEKLIKDVVSDGWDDRKKADAIHDYLAKICEYDEEFAPVSYTALGALEYGKAVCEGYSAAFNLLCRAAGVRSLAVSNSTHMWNAVLTDGVVYHYDATHDDIGETALDTYRGIPDGELSDQNHEGYNLPDKKYFSMQEFEK